MNSLSDIIWLVLFGAACYVVTLLIRKVVETAQPHLKKKPYVTVFSSWWNQVILYAIPITTGAILACSLKGTSVVPSEVDSFPGALMYGVVLGSLSSILYKVLKMLIIKKGGVESDEALTAATKSEKS